MGLILSVRDVGLVYLDLLGLKNWHLSRCLLSSAFFHSFWFLVQNQMMRRDSPVIAFLAFLLCVQINFYQRCLQVIQHTIIVQHLFFFHIIRITLFTVHMDYGNLAGFGSSTNC